MKRLLSIIICIVMLAGCGITEKTKADNTEAEMQNVSAEAAISSQPSKISSPGKFSANDVDKILYFDDSKPLYFPADTYTEAEE